MIKTYGLTLMSLAFLPLALILVLLGINAIAPNRKRGIWLKLALAVNTSLVLALGFFGTAGKANAEGERLATCYSMIASDLTQIDDVFEASADWQNLENKLWTMENYIRTGSFDYDTADELYGEMKTSINNMRSDGMISDVDSEVLLAYVGARHEYYSTNVGSVRCYEKIAIPPGKETTKEEIAETTEILRQLYEEGKLDSDAYSTTLATLEEKLALYTEKEDNAVLRQLLLDLADGFSGTYFE
jgi:DNA-binding transcriptional regulator GbsR (MarR family)